VEATNSRILTLSGYDKNMTVERCASICNGKAFMGIEYGMECYCGDSLKQANIATDGRCKMACAGDASEICGGSWGVSVYTMGLPYVGCAVDQAATGGARSLSASRLTAADMSIDKCLGFCAAYPLAGLENGNECYCGGPSITVGASGCSTPCVGNPSQTCGGAWRLSVYNNTAYVPPTLKSPINGYTYRGCFVDSATRALGRYVSANDAMTQDMCVSTCARRGYSVAGVEYGRECWCGSSMPTVPAASAGECDMKCGGDASQVCGSAWRLNVWAM
jgi:hypothetical protein